MPREWMLTASLSVQVPEEDREDVMRQMVEYFTKMPRVTPGRILETKSTLAATYQNLSFSESEVEVDDEEDEFDTPEHLELMKDKAKRALKETLSIGDQQADVAIRVMQDYGIVFKAR